jgi:hypothetical protein
VIEEKGNKQKLVPDFGRRFTQNLSWQVFIYKKKYRTLESQINTEGKAQKSEKTTALKIRDARGFVPYGRCGKCISAEEGHYKGTQKRRR